MSKKLSDLGLGRTPIKDALTNVDLADTYIWYIRILDFPHNLKYFLGYESCKKYIYDHLVRHTVSKKNRRITYHIHVGNGLVPQVTYRYWPYQRTYGVLPGGWNTSLLAWK